MFMSSKRASYGDDEVFHKVQDSLDALFQQRVGVSMREASRLEVVCFEDPLRNNCN